MRKLIPLAASALLILAARADDAPPAPSRELITVIQNLGNADFATRERAQQDLQKIPTFQRDALAALAEKSTDEEIKSRLLEQLGKMDDLIATDMPPISINFRDASLPTVARALSQATHANIDIASPYNTAARFSLSAKDQPFWEVIRQLSPQDPVTLAAGSNSTELLLNDHNAYTHTSVVRGIAVMTSDAILLDHKNGVSFFVAATLDPRIQSLGIRFMTIDDARDERGIAFPKTGGDMSIDEKSAAAEKSRFACSHRFLFDAPDAHGTKLSIKGTISFLAQLESKTVDIPKATDQRNKPLPLLDSTITFRDIIRSDPTDDRNIAALVLQITPKNATATPPEIPGIQLPHGKVAVTGAHASAGTRLAVDSEATPGGLFLGEVPQPPIPIAVHVTDAKGRHLADYSILGGTPVTSIHAVGGIFQEPLSFSFTIPTRTREVKIPFELKDVPIQP